MFCTKPLLLKNGTYVPCYTCMSCRILRASEWRERLQHEMVTRKDKGYFITLTYDDEHLPRRGTLVKSHIRNFIRRLKYENREKGNIVYYGCGEYGDVTGRPHYHLIVIGCSFPRERFNRHGGHYSHDDVGRLWRFGNNVVGNADRKSLNYVTGYVRKKILGRESSYAYAVNGLEPPFAIMSKRIGYEFFRRNFDKIYKSVIDEHKQGAMIMPRYYKRKIKDESPGRDLKMKESYERDFKDRVFRSVLKRERDGEEVDPREMDLLEAEYRRFEKEDAFRRDAENEWYERNIKRGVL